MRHQIIELKQIYSVLHDLVCMFSRIHIYLHSMAHVLSLPLRHAAVHMLVCPKREIVTLSI